MKSRSIRRPTATRQPNAAAKPARRTQQPRLTRFWQPLFDALPDLVAIISPDFRILHANRAMLERLHMPLAQIIGQSCFLCMHAAQKPPATCPLAQLLADRQPHTVRIFEPRLDGEFDVSVTPLYDGKGKLVGVVHIARDVTPQVHAHANLLALIENIDNRIWSVDTQYRLIAGNSVFHRYTSAQLGHQIVNGESVLQADFPPEVREEWRANYERALRGERFTIENVTRFTAEPRWVEYAFNPIRTADGQIVGVTVFGNDITEHKRIEITLLQRESDLATLIDNTPDIIVRYDLQGRHIFANTAIEKMFGVPMVHILGKTHLELGMPATAAEKLRAIIQRIATTQQEEIFEMPLPLRTGTYHVLARGVPELDGGKVASVLFVIRDITARHCAEEERIKFAFGIECSNDAVFLTARDGTIEYVNPAFEKLYGWSRAEAIGKTPRLLKSGTLDQAAYTQFWKTLLAKQVVEHEIVNRTRDGRLITVESFANPILNEEGKIIGFLAIQHDITERKQVERARAQERNLLRTLIDNLPENIFVKDNEGRYILSNASHSRFLGVTTPAAVIDKTVFDFFPEHIAARMYADDHRVLDTGEPLLNREEKILAPLTEQIRWNLTSKVPLRDEQGTVVGLVGISRDITEQRHVTAELAEQKARFQQLFENTPIAIALLDLNDYIQDINPAFERIFQYTRTQALGQPLKQVLVPHHLREQAHAFSARVLRGESLQATSLRQRQDGALVPVQIFGVPVIQNGTLVASFAMYADISERQQAQDALRASEERFRLLVESQGEGVGITDVDENIIFANPAAAAIFGVAPDSLVGRNVREFTTPAQFEIIQAQTARRWHGERDTYEVEIIRPDGERRSLILTATPQFDSAGQFTGSLAVFRDMTERKHMEEQLRFASTHDALTTLYNRAFFEEELERFEKGRSFPFSIVAVDVDDLKKTNDTLGHSVGDELLRRTARVLQAAFRGEDVIARIGGDEFAVLLPDTNELAAGDMLARVRLTLHQHNLATPTQPALSLSLGIATGEKHASLTEILRQADQRMYLDKASKERRT